MIRTILITAVAVALQAQVTSLMPPPVVQFFDDNGNPLAGGRICTYAAGTSTPLATYTDSTGGTSNGTSVLLGANGEAVNNIWLSPVAYKIVVRASGGDGTCGAGGGTIRKTVDNVYDWGQILRADLANTTDVSKGDALVGVKQPFTGSTATTAHEMFSRTINVRDFGALCDGTTDDTVAFQAAIDAASTRRATVLVPYSSSSCRISSVNVKPYAPIISNGKTLIQKIGTSTDPMFYLAINGGANQHDIVIRGMEIIGNQAVAHDCIFLEGNAAVNTHLVDLTVGNCGKAGVHIKAGNVVFLDMVWLTESKERNLYIESSNDVYVTNATLETGVSNPTTIALAEINVCQNCKFDRVHTEQVNAIPAFKFTGASPYTLENVSGYVLVGGLTIAKFIDLDTSYGKIGPIQIWQQTGTSTLTALITDVNGVTWNTSWPGYAVTKTGFDRLGDFAGYTRAMGTANFGTMYVRTVPPASDLPEQYSGTWYNSAGAVFGGETAGDRGIFRSANIRRKADNSGWDLLDVARPGWFDFLSDSLDEWSVYRSPSTTYVERLVHQIKHTGTGVRRLLRADAGQSGNLDVLQNSGGTDKVWYDSNFALNHKALIAPVAAPTTTYNVTAEDEVVRCDSTAGSVTINLPAAVTGRKLTVFKAVAANNCVIDPNAAETINGAATLTLTTIYGWAQLVGYAGTWLAMIPGTVSP